MFTKKKLSYVLLIGLVMIFMSSCKVEEPEVVQVEEPTVTQTNTPIPPTPTEVPPTETPVPPTATPLPPTETPIPPTATLSPEEIEALPEEPVTEWEDMVGTWEPEKFKIGFIGFAGDGTTILKDSTGSVLDTAQCNFSDDVLSCTSDTCSRVDSTGTGVEYYTCTSTYHIFMAKHNGTPVRLRYEVIDDPDDIRRNMIWV